ncbi:MAG: ATP-grasp domain-containing protein [Acidimicrobiales bacterium]
MSGRPLILFASSPQFPDLHDDWPLERAALDDVGIDARTAVWSDPAVHWSACDLVVANGVWDNIHHAAAFSAWLDRLTAEGVPVVNPPAMLRWNLDKRYLRDLEDAGLPTVPTLWVEPDRGPFDGSSLTLPAGEVVVKPSISGGGYRTARYRPHEHDQALRHVAALVDSGRTAMVQPYQPAVDARGEAGLVFLGGVFSHAFHKDPLIRRGVGPTDSLVDNQVTRAATATAGQLDLARQAVTAAERLLGPTTYARVDIVERADGAPAVLELELLDPALFFVHHPEGAVRLADVLRHRLAGE